MDLSRAHHSHLHHHNDQQHADQLALTTPASSSTTDAPVQVQSLKDQYGHVAEVNPSLERLEQLELVFECYEVQGSLTVYFATGSFGGEIAAATGRRGEYQLILFYYQYSNCSPNLSQIFVPSRRERNVQSGSKVQQQ